MVVASNDDGDDDTKDPAWANNGVVGAKRFCVPKSSGGRRRGKRRLAGLSAIVMNVCVTKCWDAFWSEQSEKRATLGDFFHCLCKFT